MTTPIVYPGIKEYLVPFAGYFHRSEGRALAQGYVSITPLNWDLTDHAALQTAGEWLVDLPG